MKKCLALLLAVAGVVVPAVGEERRADAPLVVNGELQLTTTDFQAYLEKVPDQIRTEFSAGSDRVKKTVDGLWVQRVVAQRAREAGLDKDPLVAARLRQAQEIVLVEVYLLNIEKQMKYPDLLPRAREVYQSQAAKFKVPGRVHLRHVLVDMKCRKPEEGMARAREIRNEILAGKEDFATIAKRSSDDPSKAKNGGDLGFIQPSEFPDEQFRNAIAKLQKPGEVSEPFETRFGVHVVQLVKREPERTRTFDEVKDELIAAEKQKLLDDARGQVLVQVRNDPKTQLYLENVESILDKARAQARPIKPR